MFTSVVAALALAASVSRVAASPIEHIARGYRQDAGILEDYTRYHIHYLALNCQDKHNTTFFDECCHPLLGSQKPSDRPAQCIPSASAFSSAALAEPTATIIDEDPIYDDCDDETTSSTAPASTSSATHVAQATTAAASTTTSKAASAEPITSHHPTTTQEPTTTHAPTTTKASSTAEATTSASGSGGGEVFEGGQATFFTQNGVAGACGDKHDDHDLIVAADYRRYGSLDKESDLCGKKVHITNTKNGKTVTAIVADACPTCKNSNSLDLSLGAFDKIGERVDGVLPIAWYFV